MKPRQDRPRSMGIVVRRLKNPLILKVGKNQWDRRGARARGRGGSALGRRDFRPNGRVLYGAARPHASAVEMNAAPIVYASYRAPSRRSHVFIHRVKNEGMHEAPPRQHRPEHHQDHVPIFLAHPCQHRPPPEWRTLASTWLT